MTSAAYGWIADVGQTSSSPRNRAAGRVMDPGAQVTDLLPLPITRRSSIAPRTTERGTIATPIPLAASVCLARSAAPPALWGRPGVTTGAAFGWIAVAARTSVLLAAHPANYQDQSRPNEQAQNPVPLRDRILSCFLTSRCTS